MRNVAGNSSKTTKTMEVDDPDCAAAITGSSDGEINGRMFRFVKKSAGIIKANGKTVLMAKRAAENRVHKKATMIPQEAASNMASIPKGTFFNNGRTQKAVSKEMKLTWTHFAAVEDMSDTKKLKSRRHAGTTNERMMTNRMTSAGALIFPARKVGSLARRS